MNKQNKRYQECSKIEKFWRRRWYLTLPFLWLKYQYFIDKKVINTIFKDGEIVDGKENILKGQRLWEILIGEIQGSDKMNWVWTQEELWEKFKNK